MTSQPLVIQATCQPTHARAYEGKDLWLQIGITNTGKTPVGFPLAYRQKTGPTIRLINGRTHMDTYVKTNLADPKLRETLTMIPPGESVVLDWVIKPADLQQFGKGPLDNVSAEIVLQAEIQIEGKYVEFIGAHTIRIIGPITETSLMTHEFPMAISLEMDPATSNLTVTLRNMGDNTFALPNSISFGTTPGIDPLWVEINAPIASDLALPPLGPLRRKFGVRLVKSGESVFLGGMDLKKCFVLKPHGTYNVTVYYQDKHKLRPEEALSAFWTVSNMKAPVVSTPLTFQVP